MQWIRIEAGSFRMGGARGEFDERPAHRVTISKPFFIAETPVTNAEYERFDPAHRALRGKSAVSSGDDEAVVFVSWHDAVRYCDWLSRREGKPYRLPTEAEWEYAARAGTTTDFWTGDHLPSEFQRNQKTLNAPEPADLRVGTTPPNPWGLRDVHGIVEEWCLDWYGPYDAADQTDPVGRADGDFKVTRGGSHSTPVEYLRSANRLGTLPDDRHGLIGFRVVQAGMPRTQPLPVAEPGRWGRSVDQSRFAWPEPSPEPRFDGPRVYVRIPENADGPLYDKHNHDPAITALPNGDLLAIWYTCRTESGRELGIAASRLRRGTTEWEPADPFWDAPDRNDHAPNLWWDGDRTVYHFNGLGTDGTWRKLALILRTSVDNGATWSKARIISPEHGDGHMPIPGMLRTRDGKLVLHCDAVPGGDGGTLVWISDDGRGERWRCPGKGKAAPRFAAGERGAWIAGIHAGLVELADGRWLALGRGDSIENRMPMSVSDDAGESWTYAASPFPPITSGQRLVLMRLQEGPILLVSFKENGMFGVVSRDEGKTWTAPKLISHGGPPRTFSGGAWTGTFTLDANHAEPKGYLHATQTPDGVIHLISSALHYRLNLPWLEEKRR